MESKQAIARPGQLLQNHLLNVANIAQILAAKIGLPEAGYIIGLLHDLGKYSKEFQRYIKAIENDSKKNLNSLQYDEDEEAYDHKTQKGKIDHSTAGAQWIWQALSKYGQSGQGELCGQILSLSIASHHSGLIDCLKMDKNSPEKIDEFKRRINKIDEKTHLLECVEKIDTSIFNKISSLDNLGLVNHLISKIKEITRTFQHGQEINDAIKAFYLGFLTRFLFSCLIDADRIDSANPDKIFQTRQLNWETAIERFEDKLSKLSTNAPIEMIRRNISNDCYHKAKKEQGIYTLTVPTGGGKTYASLRFALHHAKTHNLDRIIYVIPYTSIIEQNADAIRKMVEQEGDFEPWVLEHHSNLEPERQTWHSKITAENWEAPIILTTMVQFLEVLFGGGTRGVRRLHQLANSVLIFDEIQTLPIRCVHLFCNALNFLAEHTKTTAVLCTATQPLLNKLRAPEKGQLFVPKEHELINDVDQLFKKLKRVNVIDMCKPAGWSKEDIKDLVLKELSEKKSCLVIVNTKTWAKTLYELCKNDVPQDIVFHLSTNQCAAHRKILFDKIKLRLKEKLPVLCISTQLIEAGVDISFATVIRFLAGFDSIAQAAGRCNRHGELAFGSVYIVNPDNESIDSLQEIKVGRDKAQQILEELKANQKDFLSPETIKRYFEYYFFKRAEDMDYPVKTKKIDTTLFDLLAGNEKNIFETTASGKWPLLRQSFMAAGNIFEAIDAPTQAIIVPYGEGIELIAELGRVAIEFDQKKYYTLLRKAQRYTVNVFPNVWKKLCDEEAVYQIQEEGIYALHEQYYSDEFGLATRIVAQMSTNIV